jgi:hypothetical protein
VPREVAKNVAARSRDRLFKTIAVALGLFLAGVTGEIGLRLNRAAFRASQERQGGRVFRCDRTSAHRELVYEGVPSQCDNNALGFDDVEHSVEPSPGALRIVVVGDSVAAAQGVPREAGLARVLERQLSPRVGRPVDIVTLAHGGYNTSQETFLVEHDALPLEPRLVVLVYVLNDADHAIYGTSSGPVAAYYDRPPSYLLSWLAGRLYKIDEKRSEGPCGPLWANIIHCAHADEVRKNFQRIGDVGRRGHVPVLVAIHPFLARPLDGPDYPYAALHARLADLAREAGIETVDLREAYRGYEVDDLVQDLDDQLHPNELGHNLVGTYLAQILAARSDL